MVRAKHYVLSIFLSALLCAEVTNYHVTHKSRLGIDAYCYTLLRHFEDDGVSKYLAVNVDTLETSVRKSSFYTRYHCDARNSSYDRLKEKVLEKSSTLHNAGVSHFESDGYVVSVDMCPSSKPRYETELFQQLFDENHTFAVAISAHWAKQHSKDFHILAANQDKITWINHTHSHPYKRGIKIDKNFMLLDGVVLKDEITLNEIYLLKSGCIPSIFFRFPGLVSTPSLVKDVVNMFGLIVLGSDAWLAKGETIKNGSLVLLHGNKNEPLGVERFSQERKKRQVKLRSFTEVFTSQMAE